MKIRQLTIHSKDALTACLLLIGLVLFTLATTAQTVTVPNQKATPSEPESTSKITKETIELKDENGVKTLVISKTIDGVSASTTLTGEEAEEWLKNNQSENQAWTIHTLEDAFENTGNTAHNMQSDASHEERNVKVIHVKSMETGEIKTATIATNSESKNTAVEDVDVELVQDESGYSKVVVTTQNEAGETTTEVVYLGKACTENKTDEGVSNFGVDTKTLTKVYVIETEEAIEGQNMESLPNQAAVVKCFIRIEEKSEEQATKRDLRKELKVNELKFYPNPNDGRFTLEADPVKKGNVTLQITDISGRVVLNRQLSGEGLIREEIDISESGAGIYFLTLEQGKKSISKKIVIE